jgi:DNA-directed RNA polymerase subunit RPC12/RpoP
MQKPCSECKELLEATLIDKTWYVDCEDCQCTTKHHVYKDQPANRYMERIDDIHPPRPTGF